MSTQVYDLTGDTEDFENFGRLSLLLHGKDTSGWLRRDWVAVWAYRTFRYVSKRTGTWPSKRERHALRKRLMSTISRVGLQDKKQVISMALRESTAWFYEMAFPRT